MPRYIIGLEQEGTEFYNSVINYCHQTGQPNRDGIVDAIFHEVISQILSRMTFDTQVFMGEMMALPIWQSIHYLPDPVDYGRCEPFKNDVRAFGLWLHHRLITKGNLLPNHHYVFEHANRNIVVAVAIEDGNSF